MSDYRKGVVDKPNNLKYSFDFMEDEAKSWKCEHITKSMIAFLPYGIFNLSTFDVEAGYQFIQKDYYGKPINDLSEYLRERNLYIDYLYQKYKKKKRLA